MSNIDYYTERADRYGRPFADYPSPGPAMSYPVAPAVAPRSLNGAVLAAVLVGAIGVAAIGAVVFYHADSAPAPVAAPKTTIVMPGQTAPQAPQVVSPVVV